MIEKKTTEQISEDYEYETAYCKTINDLNNMGETQWVHVEDVVKYKEFIQQLYYNNWINSNILSPNEFNNKIELELTESTDIKKIKIDKGKNNDA